jgi:hypothetical protein
VNFIGSVTERAGGILGGISAEDLTATIQHGIDISVVNPGPYINDST